ncbi:MAG: hypothetical protein ABIH52_00690 [Candidatus Aenigmatarchaeota archaeon]|nr:hypothetical protein [Nanoarchaeota archaeon]
MFTSEMLTPEVSRPLAPHPKKGWKFKAPFDHFGPWTVEFTCGTTYVPHAGKDDVIAVANTIHAGECTSQNCFRIDEPKPVS